MNRPSGTRIPWGTRVVPAGIACFVIIDAVVLLTMRGSSGYPLVSGGVMLLGVVVATALGGRIVGIISAAAAFALTWYFFMPPRDSFALRSGHEITATVAYGLTLLVLVMLVSRFLDTVERLREVEAELDSNLSKVQRALLPGPMPSMEGVTLGHAYRPAAGRDAGGDWYTIVPLGNGRIGLGIGDAAGHGLDAIGAMARSRFTMLAYALDELAPADVLARANDSVVRTSPRTGVFATATYGVLDLYRRTWIEARAGHPPTIVRRASGYTEVLEHRSGLPLGIEHDTKYVETLVELEHDDMVTLFTDGLIDWPEHDIDRGLARLRERLATLTGHDLEAVCDVLVRDLGNPHDDVALLVGRVDLRGATAA